MSINFRKSFKGYLSITVAFLFVGIFMFSAETVTASGRNLLGLNSAPNELMNVGESSFNPNDSGSPLDVASAFGHDADARNARRKTYKYRTLFSTGG